MTTRQGQFEEALTRLEDELELVLADFENDEWTIHQDLATLDHVALRSRLNELVDQIANYAENGAWDE